MAEFKNPQRLFGIGEWYGTLLSEMSGSDCRNLANLQITKKSDRVTPTCPFQASGTTATECSKEGGVCSLRAYERAVDGTITSEKTLCTTCPSRFLEGGLVFQWIGNFVLGASKVTALDEIGFLEREDEATNATVGRIDNVLVVPNSDPLQWCAVEFQAVYFQGAAMKSDFELLRTSESPRTYFPTARRQPDYRSSGPKRLMPQLQTKVPTLRRWGKKMVVVVDTGFFGALGQIREVRDVSNCDIVWLVVGYQLDGGESRLTIEHAHLTTLEHSVEGLVAGVPVSLPTFEERILKKLARSSST